MKWLESIRFRTTPSDAEGLLGLLQQSVRSMPGTEGLLDASVYVNADYEGDVVVLLQWETRSHDPAGSGVGQRVSHALRGKGLVNHSVWRVKLPGNTSKHNGSGKIHPASIPEKSTPPRRRYRSPERDE